MERPHRRRGRGRGRGTAHPEHPAYRAPETRDSFAAGARVGPRCFATGEALDGERVFYDFMRPITSEAQLRLEFSRAQACSPGVTT